MATRPKAVIESRNGEKFSPITIAKNVLTDDGQNLHDILSNRKEDMMTPTIENSSSMFKVGQGDNVDYSSNVVNGAYEGMVLKGKTMVNCIQESSSQDVVLPYEFEDGRYITINDTKESGALGVELKGQTLVNTLIYEHTSLASGATRIDDTITLDKSQQWSRIQLLPSNSLWTPNETYTTILYDVVGDTSTLHMCSQIGATVTKTPFTNNKAVFTMGTGQNNSNNRLGYIESSTIIANETVSFKVVILKGNYSDVDVPYFTGMTSCKMPNLKSVNQLFDYSRAVKPSGSGTVSFTNNGRSLKANFEVTRDCVNVTNITLPAGTYEISYEIRGAVTLPDGASLSSSRAGLSMFKSSQNWYNAAESLHVNFANINPTNYTKAKKTITFDESVTVAVVYHGWNNNPVGWCEIKDIRIVPQGKTSILSLPEEVVLRSLPNGVCDTFNTRTGVYTQRIGEVFLNGSERWAHNPAATDSTLGLSGFNLSVTDTPNRKLYGITLCDKMPVITSLDKVGVYNGQGLNILIKSNSTNVNTLKEILAKDPITVQYQLENPIVTKINLPSTLKSWNTTTHIYSEIPENTLYPILSHLIPTYPVILKPSTKYSIVANSYSNGHTNSTIDFNLGGATVSTTVGNRVTTITTPSTLSNELLIMSGRGNMLNNVMVIEGDVVGDEPYFEGMCDCKSPILSNVGKNLYSTIYLTDNAYVDKIRLKANTRYTLKNSVAFSPQNRFKFRVYDLKQNPLNDSQLVEIHKDLYYNSASMAFCNNGNKDYIECSFTPKIDCYISITSFNSGVDSNRDYHIQLEEGSAVTTYEPYKSNILSANGDKIELTEDMFEQGGVYFTKGQSFADATNNTAPDRIRLKTLLNLKPNTTYRVAIDNAYKVGVQLYNNEESAVSDTGWVSDATFTTKGGENAVALVIRKLSSTANISMSDFKNIKLQLSEVDKTIVLRSLPNGVCDTLNVETGEYVQRVREVVLNGSEEWYAHGTYGYALFDINGLVGFKHITTDNSQIAENIISNSIPITNIYYLHSDNSNQTGLAASTNSYSEILLSISEVPRNNVTMLKQYLSQNPITVQYELATPIVKTVDLSGYPFSYKNGHAILSSGSIEQSLTPKVEYSVITNRNGQIRSNQRMVERHQKQLDHLQAIILTNLVNTQYEQTLTNLKYDLKNVREEVK